MLVARAGESDVQWQHEAADRRRRPHCCGSGAISPAAFAARVLCRGLSADVPLAPHGRAAAGIVPEGLRQGHRDHGHRQRGDGGGHDDAAAARPRRRLALAPRSSPAICCWGPRPTSCSASTWPTPRAPRTAARATPITATPPARRLPMISHLGKMPSLVVGGTWAARRHGEDVFGLAVIGDGGSSTGEIHESLNVASVQKVPGAVPDRRTITTRSPRRPAFNTTAGSCPIGRTVTALPAGRSTAPMPGESTRRSATRWRRCRPRRCRRLSSA